MMDDGILTHTGLTSEVQLHAEECRYLEYQIQSVHASLARTGTSLLIGDGIASRLLASPTIT